MVLYSFKLIVLLWVAIEDGTTDALRYILS